MGSATIFDSVAIRSILYGSAVALFLTLCSGAALAADSTVPGTFATIQLAIDDAGTGAGDTITVTSAVHAESNIQITKSVTIEGTGIATTTLNPGAGNIGFRPLADNITIRDMTIDGGSQSVRFELAAGTIDSTTLERVSFENTSSRGIEIHNATTVTNLLVTDCNFENNPSGLRTASSATVDGIQFLDTTFTQNNVGIYQANDGGTSTMKDLVVRNCTFTEHNFTFWPGGQTTAIFLEEIQDALIEDNQFVDNRRDIQIFKWYQASVLVSNVLIQNNTFTGTKDSVFAIFNAEHASGQTTFAGVTFTRNTATIDPALTDNGGAVFAGAHSAGPGSLGGLGWDTVHVTCNNFLQAHTGEAVRFFNTGVAVGQELGGASIDVTNNWWGTPSLPAVAALMEILSITTYFPHLVAPVDAQCGTVMVPSATFWGLVGLAALGAIFLALGPLIGARRRLV